MAITNALPFWLTMVAKMLPNHRTRWFSIYPSNNCECGNSYLDFWRQHAQSLRSQFIAPIWQEKLHLERCNIRNNWGWRLHRRYPFLPSIFTAMDVAINFFPVGTLDVGDKLTVDPLPMLENVYFFLGTFCTLLFPLSLRKCGPHPHSQ